jgi:hypothetical protein
LAFWVKGSFATTDTSIFYYLKTTVFVHGQKDAPWFDWQRPSIARSQCMVYCIWEQRPSGTNGHPRPWSGDCSCKIARFYIHCRQIWNADLSVTVPMSTCRKVWSGAERSGVEGHPRCHGGRRFRFPAARSTFPLFDSLQQRDRLDPNTNNRTRHDGVVVRDLCTGPCRSARATTAIMIRLLRPTPAVVALRSRAGIVGLFC